MPGEATREARITVATSLPNTLDKDRRRFQAVANSSVEVDRHRSVIRATAWEKRIGIFAQNPVGLWAHNFCNTEPPIFSCQDLEVNPKIGLLFWPTWQEKGLDPRADLIWHKYTSSPPLLRAFSVGFYPWEWIDNTDSRRKGDPAEEDKPALLNDAEKDAEIVYTEVELHEISACPVPSNRGSLTRSITGEFRPDRGIVRALEQMGFIYQARLAVNPGGETLGMEVTQDELIETLDLFSGSLAEIPVSRFASQELASIKDAYGKLGKILQIVSKLEAKDESSEEEIQQYVNALEDQASKLADKCESLISVNQDLRGRVLEKLVAQ